MGDVTKHYNSDRLRSKQNLAYYLPRHKSVPGSASIGLCLRQVSNGTCPFFMKFYYVYVLYNKSKSFIYIGYSENLKPRVARHNFGKIKSTKFYLPLELIHYEAYRNKKDAKRRELYLKSNKGKTTLATMLKEYFAKIH
ncbi:MAG: GIY-YIG nuclease family protein [Patescibacteria group bacterium]